MKRAWKPLMRNRRTIPVPMRIHHHGSAIQLAMGIQEIRWVVPMAYAYEAHLGKATLLATVSGSEVAAFDCEITRVNTQQSPSVKGMIVTVTDERLLSTTGGIVQGMSGSPILQNGRLVGAVTHVLVNDPTRGYGIFAQTMLEQAKNAVQNGAEAQNAE